MGSGSKRAKEWLERINDSNHMLWLLGTLSFLETIIVPIPIEIVLIPLMAINRDRIWIIAAVTMAGCLIAAMVGYGVGLALHDTVGSWFIETMGMQESFESFQQFFNQYGFIAILSIGILPIPFQVAMITAGISGYPWYLFVAAALIARGVRYFGLAWLVKQFGERAKTLWKQHAVLASLGAGVVVIGVATLMQLLANQVM